MSSDALDRGYLTMAVGRREYFEMAADLALSLREWGDLPLTLATDARGEVEANKAFPGIFHSITRVEERFLFKRAMKFGAALASPYRETVFFDADSLIVADPSFIWEGAGEGALTMAGRILGPETDVSHHGFSTRYLMKKLRLNRYLKTNSGVFYFRREGGIEAMEACLTCYRDEILPLRSWFHPRRFLGDELAFAAVGGREGFSVFPSPGPMYWSDDIPKFDPDRPWKPVLHFMLPIPDPLLERLLEGVAHRRVSAGLPPHDSHEAWRARVLKGTVNNRLN